MFTGLKFFILILIASIIALIFSPSKTLGQIILFSDDFNDGNAIGWNVIGSPGWNIQNGQYGIFLNPGLSNTMPNDSSWNYNWTNIKYEVDLLGKQGVDKNILVKFKDTSNFIEFHGNDQGIVLEKASSSGGAGILAASNMLLSNNVIYHFEFDVIDNSRIKVYLNGNLLFDVNEKEPLITSWKIGLRAGTGATSPTEVWFDNVVISELPISTPSPTPTASPTPTPAPTSTPTLIIGQFELPFNYSGRLGTNPAQFKNAFWGRLTAAFDHLFPLGVFRPFTGNTYLSSDCAVGTLGIICYDTHNGTDFSTVGGKNVYAVANGSAVYTSPHTGTKCTPNVGGYGCVIIVRHPGNIYGLYAHLDRIYVNDGNNVTASTLLGEMGETGCPDCGEHLHFGAMKPTSSSKSTLLMTRTDWQELLYKIRPTSNAVFNPSCTYTAPNGVKFSFMDPSGWAGLDKDPWSLPKSKGGCGINSRYLWKYDIGTSP